MAIKKAFLDLHTLLTANQAVVVGDIMDQITELCSGKGAGGASSTVHRDAEGNVVAILDYYFKKWLPIEFVEFGAKANSSTGLNTMCKLGTSFWTKQQRDFKKGKENLLELVSAGEVAPTEIQEHLDRLEEERSFIADYPVPAIAFDSIEDLEAADRDDMIVAVEEYNDAVAAAAAEAAEEEDEAA